MFLYLKFTPSCQINTFSKLKSLSWAMEESSETQYVLHWLWDILPGEMFFQSHYLLHKTMNWFSQETAFLVHFTARGENSPWWIITFPLILHTHSSPARAAAMQTTRLALEKPQLPAALQLSAVAPGWAKKGPPQKPSVRTERSSELPAFVLPEGTFSIPESQMVNE